jgi:hypothetical protein
VTWATGYHPDHSRLRIPGVLRDGEVIHQRGVTEVPGLYFLGLSWQRTRGSALLGFVAADAAYLADRLACFGHTPRSNRVDMMPGTPANQPTKHGGRHA